MHFNRYFIFYIIHTLTKIFQFELQVAEGNFKIEIIVQLFRFSVLEFKISGNVKSFIVGENLYAIKKTMFIKGAEGCI